MVSLILIIFHHPSQPVPLFSKIEDSLALSLKCRFAGRQQEASKTVEQGGKGGRTIENEDFQEQLDKQVCGVINDICLYLIQVCI